MKPTDDEINAAMAEVRGWRDVAYMIVIGIGNKGIEKKRVVRLCHPDRLREPKGAGDANSPEPDGTEDRIRAADLPRYCTDRNTQPEVWGAACLVFKAYIEHLTLLSCGNLAPGYAERDPYSWWEDTVTMSPRLHVIAALKALGKWQEDWED